MAGYGNIGKVHIRYKPKPPPKYKIGFCIYILCLLLFLFSWTWTVQSYRYAITLPMMRLFVSSMDFLRLWSYSQISEDKSHLNLANDVNIVYSAVSDTFQVDAKSISDALYGQGYIHCAERLFQMDYNRRKANGQLADVIGEDMISSDIWARTLNIIDLAAQDLDAQSAEEIMYLESYSAGVNAYLSENHPLPVEYLALGITDSQEISPWSPKDSLALLRMYTTGNGGSSTEHWEMELTQHLLDEKVGTTNASEWGIHSTPNPYEIDITDDVIVLPGASSSYSYVVSDSLLSGDSPAMSSTVIDEPQFPAEMFHNTLSFDLPIDSDQQQRRRHRVTGSSFPGVPFVITSGRNDAISWSLSPSSVDTSDILTERLKISQDEDGQDIFHYWQHNMSCQVDVEPCVEGHWSHAQVHYEEIKVRPGKDNTPNGVTVELISTPNGVVIPRNALTGFISPGFNRRGVDIGELDMHVLASVDRMHHLHMSHWARLNLAENWQDFTSALEGMHALSWNALYADNRSNIGSLVTGRSPLRRTVKIKSKSSDEKEVVRWVGDESVFLPSSDEPEPARACPSCLFNPPQRVIASAPLAMTTRSKNTNQRFPKLSSELSSFFVADKKRSLAELAAQDFWSFESGAREYLRAVCKSLQLMHTDSAVAKILQFLGMDGQAECSSGDAATDTLMDVPNMAMFLEALRIRVRDKVLSSAGRLAPLVYGASHSPFRKSTALTENTAFVDTIIACVLESNKDDSRECILIVQQAAMEAYHWLEEQHGAPSGGGLSAGWNWREVFLTRFEHPLSYLEYLGEVLSPGPAQPPEASSAMFRLGVGGDSFGKLATRDHSEIGCLLFNRWGSRGRCHSVVYRSLYQFGSGDGFEQAGMVMIAPHETGRIGRVPSRLISQHLSPLRLDAVGEVDSSKISLRSARSCLEEDSLRSDL